ncbi:hypothetical protein VTH06DRAFT_6246 [Thermothelomyces fergusii]
MHSYQTTQDVWDGQPTTTSPHHQATAKPPQLPPPRSLPPSPSRLTTTTTTSPLTQHLRTLPARLHASRQARQTAQAAQELDLAGGVLAPHVEAFLGQLDGASSGRAELTLVPASAVPRGAALSDADARRAHGDVVRAVRVDQQQPGSVLREEIIAEFGDWGRFDSSEGDGGGGDGEPWWFGDEAMARRLAAYLRPEPDLDRKRVQARVVENSSSNKRISAASKEKPSGLARLGLGFGGGGRKKAAERAPSGSPIDPASTPGQPPAAVVGGEDPITMTVRAEEVTFRWENDFGLWESRTGWGIVITLTMRP